MGPSGLPVIPRADDRALAHDDRARRRIRAGLARSPPGQRNGLCHESLVGLSMGFRQRDASDESAGGSPSVSVGPAGARRDRKSTRLNSSHGYISYAVFCLKKKKKKRTDHKVIIIKVTWTIMSNND